MGGDDSGGDGPDGGRGDQDRRPGAVGPDRQVVIEVDVDTSELSDAEMVELVRRIRGEDP